MRNKARNLQNHNFLDSPQAENSGNQVNQNDNKGQAPPKKDRHELPHLCQSKGGRCVIVQTGKKKSA